MHEEDDDKPSGLWAAISARSGVTFGIIGLIDWLALLWGMFGDVL